MTKIPSGSLNRTFYGIETQRAGSSASQTHVLIVPFMELKQTDCPALPSELRGLNRTFYGIETLSTLSLISVS